MARTDVQAVLDMSRALEKKALFLSGVLETRKKATAEREAALLRHKSDLDLLEKVRTVLSHLLENTSKKDLKGMDSLVTYGLKSVYPEKGLEFRSEIVDSGKKVYIDMDTYRNGQKSSKDSKGSITVIESFLIRILSIIKKGGARFILADEPFAAVGQDHINNVGSLLEELSEKLGMDILLVTHNPGVSDSCMFRASLHDGDQLKLTKIGGSDKSGKVEHVEAALDANPVDPKPSKTKTKEPSGKSKKARSLT